MATNNNDLDDFFKKKDRKVNKQKKQTGLLTNNEELLKQLVIVTSATTVFKENMDFEDDEDDEFNTTGQHRPVTIDNSNGLIVNDDMAHVAINKSQPLATSTTNKSKTTNKIPVRENNSSNEQQTGAGQQDVWEEYEASSARYDQLRSKISRGFNDNEQWAERDDDEYSDEEYNRDDDQTNSSTTRDEQSSRANRRNESQQKEKQVWKIDQTKQTDSKPAEETTEKAEETAATSAPTAAKPATSGGVYRPPQMRSNAAVTVVSGLTQRPAKKEKPNIASTEEFPTLGSAASKK